MYILGKKLLHNPLRLLSIALFAIVFFLIAQSAFAAVLRISPATAEVEAGSSVSVSIILASPDQAVNAVSGTLKFDPADLEVTSISKSSSIIGLWVREPSYSNSAGSVNYEGVILNPGYTGSGSNVLTVRFRTKQVGTAELQLASSQALANDGNGTDILTKSTGATITIIKPTVKPATPKPEPEPVIEIEQPTSTAAAPLLPPAKQCRTWSSDLFEFLSSAGLAFFGVLLLLLIACLLGYLAYQRTHKGGHHARKELRHLDATVSRALLLLRDDVESFVYELHQESSKRKLTLIESKFIKTMKKNLADAREIIKKEIDDVEDSLGS